MNTITFSQYAQWYDLLYQDKDYQKEATYILDVIKKHQPKKFNSILDIGCGTGHHAYHLAQNGLQVHGIDLSKEMITIANSQYPHPSLSFEYANAVHYKPPHTYDIILSLFHVLSYQTSNNILQKFFINTYYNLKSEGLFLVDFWYGPAVLNDPPVKRIKNVENEAFSVQRIATPSINKNLNTVTIHYDLTIIEKQTNTTTNLNEVHTMRYFFYPELELFSNMAGFQLIDNLEWLQLNKELDPSNWNGLIVLKK